MQGRTAIESTSSQWAQIDYRLQIITGKSSVQIVSLNRYPAPSNQPQTATQAVLQVTDFDRDYIDKAIRNILGVQEMVFYCGHLNIHSLARPGKIFTFLLCRLNLGRIGTVQDELRSADSVLLQSEGEKDAFQYNYMINDRGRYWVEYQVSFSLGNEKEFLDNEFPCMNCQNRRAKVYCANQQLQLCEECSKDHHSSRMMNGHELERIDKVNSLPLCTRHQQKLRHYCSHCHKYLCLGCLQKGSSHGNSDHPVAEIGYLYSQKREANEAVSSRQKNHLEGLMRSLQAKREEVEDNYKRSKKLVDEVYQRAVSKLNELFSEKILIVQSEEIQLRMLSEKLQWVRTFIRFQQKNLKPIHYFQAQARFQHELGTLRPLEPRALLYVKADLAVEGGLLVGRREELERPLREVKELGGGSRLLEGRDTGQKGAIWSYDQRVELPVRGELALALWNAKTSFFSIPNASN